MAKNKNKDKTKKKKSKLDPIATVKDKAKKPKLHPNTSTEHRELYDKLRAEGVGKKKSAAVTNSISAEARSRDAAKGGASTSYDTWSRADLYDRAKELDITGRSGMGKDELIAALRAH